MADAAWTLEVAPAVAAALQRSPCRPQGGGDRPPIVLRGRGRMASEIRAGILTLDTYLVSSYSMDWKKWGARLKTLRLQRDWTQQHLAGLVGVSRNTVNRWEIGDRRPSMKLLEKLARVFRVEIQALLHDRLVPVKRVTFDAAKIFSVEQPFAVPLIGLMMAADDARHLQKTLIVAGEKVQEAATLEKPIL